MRASSKRKDEPLIGDNSDARVQEYVKFVTEKKRKIAALNGEIKDKLNEAKGEGFSKMAIRGAVKVLEMTEEQKQAKKEVDSAILAITAACADLPLFHKSAVGSED